jgi:alkaline phosphatase D
MIRTLLMLVCLPLISHAELTNVVVGGNSFATGIKIGEVTSTEAIIWIRTTRISKRMGSDRSLPMISYWNPDTSEWEVGPQRKRGKTPKIDFIDGSNIHTIEGAVPGKSSKVRVKYRHEGEADWAFTNWAAVDPNADYTRQIKLTNLVPDQRYEIVAQTDEKPMRIRNRRRRPESTEQPYRGVAGNFRTAPFEETIKNVTFMVSTGQAYIDIDLPDEGYKIYPSMLAKDPDFFVHTGDILYYDDYAKTKELAYWHWQRMYSLPTNVEFHKNVSSYFIKDDHDTWMNDCWPGQESPYMGLFTQEEGIEIFKQQVPMGEKTYRTFRWGKDLQIWLVEGRDYRSPNTMPDGPDKTIWGDEQIEWFKRTVRESDASFRVLISPTPIVGPDRKNKRDNHSNAVFENEGTMLREFLSSQKNMVVVCGDRHWQYISKDPKTGLKEYSSGPASDSHAGGWKQEDLRPMHEYLNVTGGFMSVTATRENGDPVLITRHYDVDGKLLNEDRFTGN